MTETWRDLMEKAAARRASGIDLTAEQKERLELVTKRSEAIQAGIKPPASGTYGKPPKGA